MEFYEALRAAAGHAGISIAELSKRLNRNSGYIANNISRGSSPSIDNAVLMMRKCGYEIVAVPLGSAPEESLRIDVSPSALKAEQALLEKKIEELKRQIGTLE